MIGTSKLSAIFVSIHSLVTEYLLIKASSDAVTRSSLMSL